MTNHKRKRPIEKKIRFNAAEWKYIQRKINENPKGGFQNFARNMLIQGEIKHIDYSELQKLNQEVHRIGNNINQMARLAHQFEEISNDDINKLTIEVTKLSAYVVETLKQEVRKGKS